MIEDNAFSSYGIAAYSVELVPCVGGSDSHNTCFRKELKHGVTNAQGITITMRGVAHRPVFGPECFTDCRGIKFTKIGRRFCHVVPAIIWVNTDYCQ